MKFLLLAQTDEGSIEERLGTADYSYFFLLRAYAKVLSRIGDVLRLQNAAEADPIYDECLARGERCVLLSFAPPHKTPLGLACPTVPVFAWEYPDIPGRIEERCWLNEPRNDWRYVLARTGRAITLSSYTVEAVSRSMGPEFPVVAIPSPIGSITGLAGHAPPRTIKTNTVLKVDASVVDSARIGLDASGLNCLIEEDGTAFEPADLDNLPEPTRTTTEAIATDEYKTEPPPTEECGPNWFETIDSGWELPPTRPTRINLQGTVYTAVLTPAAGRKNWEDLITAFCWAFRDVEGATLILKLAGRDLSLHHHQLLMLLTKMSPLKCRVIAINGYLSDEDYAALVSATTYYVNASLCEGLCLPLVEFLSEGVPAISPDNTAMADYITEDIAFVVASYPGVPTVWPHGDSEINRTSYHQLDWESLVLAFRRSHELARHASDSYEQMSRKASVAMQAYCGPAVVQMALHQFLCPELPCSTEILRADDICTTAERSSTAS